MATNGNAVEPNDARGANGNPRVVPAGIIVPLDPHLVHLLEELQVPFEPALVKWRANETKFIDRKLHGLCLPYADPRAYKDRLNVLISPVKWRDKYTLTTTSAKILVTCELNIDYLGCHSATGEEWSKNENATTSAEAQAFKRACAGFGLGRYFYHFAGLWLQLAHDNRPTEIPALPHWATPDGWKSGLRPPLEKVPPAAPNAISISGAKNGDRKPTRRQRGSTQNVVMEIRSMEPAIGVRLYRGLLKTVSGVWDPAQIRNVALQHTVLAHMEAAQRGMVRLDAALRRVDESVAKSILHSLELRSSDEVRDLSTLQHLVSALEKAAGMTS
jgi:hypothetical protein